MSEASVIKQNIVEQFDGFQSNTLQDTRKNAIDYFNRIGFPNLKNEEWKYTNVNRITSKDPDFSISESKSVLTSEQVSDFLITGKNDLVLVFENGIFREELSDTINLPGITVSSLEQSINNPVLEASMGTIAPLGNEAFVALNTAFLRDGIFIHINENIQVPKGIHFLHIGTSTHEHNVSTIRNLIIAEKGSHISFTESYHSIGNYNKGFVNSVTEILVKQNATVIMYKAQLASENVSQVDFTQVIQHRDSLFDIVTVTLGGDLVRNNLHIRHEDINCTTHLFGLYIADDEQLVDNHTLVDHAKPNCFSNELYKGIIGGKAAAVFNGKIFVRKDAQKTNAYQSNKNILLSDDAQVNTKPQLEIFADDVKCTHGATTGQLDEEALFYLRSRGIGESAARALLNIAFAGDVLNNIKNEILKENLMNLAISKLQKNEK